MLILTRRIGETVVIGDNISLTVLTVRGNQVRLGINAPKSVSVHRKEIYDRIQSGETVETQSGSDTELSEDVGNTVESTEDGNSEPSKKVVHAAAGAENAESAESVKAVAATGSSEKQTEDPDDNVGNRIDDDDDSESNKKPRRNRFKNPWS